MRTFRWLVSLGTAVFLILLIFAFGIHRAGDHYHCVSCGSSRVIHQRRWGCYWPERSVALSKSWETAEASRIYQELLGIQHSHTWVMWQRSGTYAFGFRRSSQMSYGVWSARWIDAYERDEPFRRWLSDRVQRGIILRESVIAAATSANRHPPGCGSDSYLPKGEDNPGDQWKVEYDGSRGER
jgi:hypothetical protein